MDRVERKKQMEQTIPLEEQVKKEELNFVFHEEF